MAKVRNCIAGENMNRSNFLQNELLKRKPILAKVVPLFLPEKRQQTHHFKTILGVDVEESLLFTLTPKRQSNPSETQLLHVHILDYLLLHGFSRMNMAATSRGIVLLFHIRE